MKFILAGNYREYTDYLMEKDAPPEEYVYVDKDGVCFKGVVNPVVIYYGTYYNRPELVFLEDMIKICSTKS